MAHSTQSNHFVIRAKIVGRVKYRTISKKHSSLKYDHLPCYSRKTEFIGPFVGPAMAFSTQLLHRAAIVHGTRRGEISRSAITEIMYSSRVSIGNIVLE